MAAALILARPFTFFTGLTAMQLRGLPGPSSHRWLHTGTTNRHHVGLLPDTFRARGQASRTHRAPRRFAELCREPWDAKVYRVGAAFRTVSLDYAVIQSCVHAEFHDALTAVDAVLGAQDSCALSRETLLEAAGRWPVATQAARARSIIALGDGLSESPRETLARAMFLQAGVPDPILQHEFVHPDGRKSRVDFWWPQLGLIVEYDGWGKMEGPQSREAMRRERIRDEMLLARPEVKAIVHLTDADTDSPERLLKRLSKYGLRADPRNRVRIPRARRSKTLEELTRRRAAA
jgi:hypothetical protein